MLDFGFYNMDCMEGMKAFPDNYFDLAIVDPPYGDAHVSDDRGGGTASAAVSIGTRGGTDKGGTCGSRMDHGVMRTGGTWAAKFSKKS